MLLTENVGKIRAEFDCDIQLSVCLSSTHCSDNAGIKGKQEHATEKTEKNMYLGYQTGTKLVWYVGQGHRQQ